MDTMLIQRIRKAERDGLNKRTLNHYNRALTLFQEWLDELGIAARDVTPIQFEEYAVRLQKRYALRTVKLHLLDIKAAYRYDRAVNPGMACPDPGLTCKLPFEPDKPPRILSVAELKAIRDNCTDERQRLLFYCFAFTGMRRDEVRALQWTEIEFDQNVIHVTGKGGKYRMIPLHPELKRQLLGVVEPSQYVIRALTHVHCKNSPLADATIDRHTKDIFRQAGITDATPHDFRRTVATSLLRDGSRFNVRENTIDKIMGWAARTTAARHYWNIPDEDMHQAMACLHPGL